MYRFRHTCTCIQHVRKQTCTCVCICLRVCTHPCFHTLAPLVTASQVVPFRRVCHLLSLLLHIHPLCDRGPASGMREHCHGLITQKHVGILTIRSGCSRPYTLSSRPYNAQSRVPSGSSYASCLVPVFSVLIMGSCLVCDKS